MKVLLVYDNNNDVAAATADDDDDDKMSFEKEHKSSKLLYSMVCSMKMSAFFLCVEHSL